LTICKAFKEGVPVFFVEGFVNPVLEGAVFIDGDFRDIHKKETKILDNEIFVVQEGSAYSANIVGTRSHHLLGWSIRWATHGLPKEIKLAGSNHVADAGDVVEHPSHVLVV
jgi:hypothetical protein